MRSRPAAASGRIGVFPVAQQLCHKSEIFEVSFMGRSGIHICFPCIYGIGKSSVFGGTCVYSRGSVIGSLEMFLGLIHA